MFGFSRDRYRPGLTLLLILAVLISSLFFSTTTLAQRRRSARTRSKGESAASLLGRGDVLYKSNDITDAADELYKQVVKQYPDTQEAGYAQYNRGSYWQRKYYIVKEQYGKEDKVALTEAEGQYYDYVTKYAERTKTIRLLSDAEFNLALVYFQQGNASYAVSWLYRMLSEAVGQDGVVHIYKVIWSSNPNDVIDREVNATQLAKVTIELINSGQSFDDVIAGIRRWAQGQGTY